MFISLQSNNINSHQRFFLSTSALLFDISLIKINNNSSVGKAFIPGLNKKKRKKEDFLVIFYLGVQIELFS